MIRRILSWLESRWHRECHVGIFAVRRSSRWPTARKRWLAIHPACAVCGTTEDVQVHHKTPVHVDPTLELDEGNFITLCEKYGHHFLYGHCLEWRAFNPNVEKDAEHARTMIQLRRFKHAA